uniref:Uncharacterized protein n=1 Tax=Lepeophtheirus salmonis TaxID=72036 RepID=A0A0K2VHT4_LEPSM
MKSKVQVKRLSVVK